MKNKFLSVLLIGGILLCLTGCGKSNPSGMYIYGSEDDNVYAYYDCNTSDRCDWNAVIKDNNTKSSATYEYTKEKNDDGTYTLHMQNIKNDTKYELIYDSEKNTLYDSELKMTYSHK